MDQCEKFFETELCRIFLLGDERDKSDMDPSGVVAGGARGPWPLLNRGANGDKGAPKLFPYNIFG